MKKIFVFIIILFLSFGGTANAISVGTFGDIDLWATDASRLTGTGGDYAGVDGVQALVGDDLTDGAINIGLFTTDTFLIEFSYGITNTAGADFIIFDGRFSSDGVSLTVDSAGSTQSVASSSFLDSGLDLVLKNTTLRFDLYGAALDLSDWGYGDGDTIYSMILEGVSESDIMGIGVLSGGDPIPEPGTMILFVIGLLGLTGVSRRKK